MSFEPWQWALLISGAVGVGLAKTGIPGVNILFVGLLANAMPARQATGIILPMLILGDVFGVLLYRRHTERRHLWKLVPRTAAGAVLGWLALQRIDDLQAPQLLGDILRVLGALPFWRHSRHAPGATAPSPPPSA